MGFEEETYKTLAFYRNDLLESQNQKELNCRVQFIWILWVDSYNVELCSLYHVRQCHTHYRE